MEAQATYRVGWVSAGFMLAIAAIADLLQVFFTVLIALAPASVIVTVIAEGFLFFYFWMCGVHFMRGKGATGRILGFFVTTVIEMVPFLDGLPSLTFYTWYTIHSSRKEDKEAFRARQAQAQAQAARDASEDEALARAYYQQSEREAQFREYDGSA